MITNRKEIITASLCLLCSLILSSGKEVTIRPGIIWRDTKGEIIQAHGIGMLQVGKTFYWYGEDRSNSKRSSAIRCYASSDLATWEFKNVIFNANDYPNLQGANLERPKVIYCDATKKYVMWVHKEGLRDYSEARVLVATCDTPDGKFSYVADFRPMGNDSRDITLFKDDDGSAYLFSAANNNADLMCYKLTPDYLNVEKVWVALRRQSREAPAVFKKDGRYYLITSACTGWGPNGNLITWSTNIYGPYGKQIPVYENNTWNTYCSQSAFVLTVKGTKATNFVFMTDRWKGWNLADSRYVFLPIPFSKDGEFKPVQWGDEWQTDLETGICSFPLKPEPAENNIAKELLAIASLSNRTNGNEAPMAVDGDLRTKWCANDGEHPHWLKVDLGAIKKVDKSEIVWELRNGTIYFYTIEASIDGKQWKVVVDKKSNTDANQTQIDSINVEARFFRLTAHGYQPPEKGGYAWASLFEWRLFSGNENVALNKKVETDSEQAGSYATRANDGQFTTAWQTGSGASTNWWKIDLGSPRSLKGCRIMWQDPGFLHQYKIEVSSDDSEWKTVVDMSKATNPVWIPVHQFNVENVRFARVLITGVEDGCWVGIREFELFDSLPLPPSCQTRFSERD